MPFNKRCRLSGCGFAIRAKYLSMDNDSSKESYSVWTGILVLIVSDNSVYRNQIF